MCKHYSLFRLLCLKVGFESNRANGMNLKSPLLHCIFEFFFLFYLQLKELQLYDFEMLMLLYIVTKIY